jgi:hypothetical protein
MPVNASIFIYFKGYRNKCKNTKFKISHIWIELKYTNINGSYEAKGFLFKKKKKKQEERESYE